MITIFSASVRNTRHHWRPRTCTRSLSRAQFPPEGWVRSHPRRLLLRSIQKNIRLCVYFIIISKNHNSSELILLQIQGSWQNKCLVLSAKPQRVALCFCMMIFWPRAWACSTSVAAIPWQPICSCWHGQVPRDSLWYLTEGFSTLSSPIV